MWQFTVMIQAIHPLIYAGKCLCKDWCTLMTILQGDNAERSTLLYEDFDDKSSMREKQKDKQAEQIVEKCSSEHGFNFPQWWYNNNGEQWEDDDRMTD